MPPPIYGDGMCLIIRARELPADDDSSRSEGESAAASDVVGANCLDRVIDLEPAGHDALTALAPDPRLAMENR